MSHQDFQDGRNGLGGRNVDSTGSMDFARGQFARMVDQIDNPATQSPRAEDPNAFQIIILMLSVAGIMGILLENKLLPVEIWQLALIWLFSTFIVFKGLKALPGWLSGTIMGLLLGSSAGYAGWLYGDLYWAGGLALVTGGLMYLFYSSIQ